MVKSVKFLTMMFAITMMIASCKNDDSVAVGSVTVDPVSLSLIPGEQATLVATVSPDDADDKSVTWSSNNEEVATVSSSGVVTALSAGTATITVTTTDGGKTAVCEVTVSDDDDEGSSDDDEGNSGDDE